jgi:lysophospholipase L1-like esterase
VLFLLAPLAAGARDQESRPADRATYLADVVEVLQRKFPKNRTVNIVCHGHSVPAGYAKTPLVDTFNAYPHLLHRRLKERFPHAVINVIVSAIGGERSDRGARRFERDVLGHCPDVVIIDYALNDRGLGLAKAKAAWGSMIEKAKARGIEVILMTPTADTRAELEEPNDRLNQHARQIRELAGEHHVGLVDSLSVFRDYVGQGGALGDLMSQVNHPNRKGHDLVVEKLLEWFPTGSPESGKTEPARRGDAT